MKRMSVLAILAWLGATAAVAHDALTRAELFERYGWDFGTAQIKIQQVSDRVSVLFGLGGNIAVSVGSQGVLIVDDQFPELMPRIKDAIEQLGGGKVDFAINTHWHWDHADGNVTLAAEGTWLVSQLNSRKMMLENHLIDLGSMQYEPQAYSPEGLPAITYDDRMQFFFNGERIDLVHFGPAHTTGDTAVIFRSDNVVHMGDVYKNSGYPFIDVRNGGTLDGIIAFCEAVLGEIDEETIIVPGHGPVATYSDLKEYVVMLQTIRERMLDLIDRGASLAQVVNAKPTAEWDDEWGDPTRLIDRAYYSLVQN